MASMTALFALSWLFPVQAWVQALSAWIGGLGAWGVLIYAAAYAGALVVLLPAAPFTVGAGLIYGLWGFPVALGSATFGASLAFLVSRHLVRGRVARLIADRPGLRAIDRAVGEEGWRVVALLRLSPLVPFNLQNYACGASSVSFWPYVAATGAGIAPGCLLYVSLGVAGRAASGGIGPARWALVGLGFAATVAATLLVGRRARAVLARRGADGAS